MVDARFVRRTVGVDIALGFTALARVAVVVRQALAHRSLIAHRTPRVGTARTRIAGVLWSFVQAVALNRWVSCQASIAEAHRMMFFHPAMSASSAGSRARIGTAKSDAGLVHRALIIGQAFERVATGGRRITAQSWWATAAGRTIYQQYTLGTGTARVRFAHGTRLFNATSVRITNEVRFTVTLLSSFSHVAISIRTARSWLAQFRRHNGFEAAAVRVTNH